MGWDIPTERPEVLDADWKCLWLVAPRGKPPNELFPGGVLQFRLRSSPVGKAVRLVVLRQGQFSTTVLDQRDFADPKRAVAHVRVEVDRYLQRGWTLRTEPPNHDQP